MNYRLVSITFTSSTQTRSDFSLFLGSIAFDGYSDDVVVRTMTTFCVRLPTIAISAAWSANFLATVRSNYDIAVEIVSLPKTSKYNFTQPVSLFCASYCCIFGRQLWNWWYLWHLRWPSPALDAITVAVSRLLTPSRPIWGTASLWYSHHPPPQTMKSMTIWEIGESDRDGGVWE